MKYKLSLSVRNRMNFICCLCFCTNMNIILPKLKTKVPDSNPFTKPKQCMLFLLVSHDDLAEIHVILPCFPEVTLSYQPAFIRFAPLSTVTNFTKEIAQ